jgi:hypothetical protein
MHNIQPVLKIYRERNDSKNTSNLSEHIIFIHIYHLPIYGQWATFIFQMVTYFFFY